MNAIIYAWYIVNDKLYMMNGTWRMLNKHVIWWMLLYYTTHNTWWMLYITHDSQRMMNDTWWVCYVTTHDTMNYNCNNAQGHNEYYHYYQNLYHCLRTHSNLFLSDLTTGTHSHTGHHQTTWPCLFLSSDASSYGQVEDHDATEGKGDKKMKRWLGTHACM